MLFAISHLNKKMLCKICKKLIRKNNSIRKNKSTRKNILDLKMYFLVDLFFLIGLFFLIDFLHEAAPGIWANDIFY